MGLFKKIAGVIGSFFQIGGPVGPAFKSNAGNIEARNAGDSAFVKLRADASVANTAALPAANTMPDGYVIEVLTQRALYLAFPTTNTWFRMPYNGAWTGTTDFYLSVAGTADGAGTVGDPITAAELQARGFGADHLNELSAVVTVHIEAGAYGAVAWTIPNRRGIGGVWFVGAETNTAASALTAVTARVAATNTPLQVTDATAAWTAGKILILTGGADAGATAVVCKSTGGGVARCAAAVKTAITVTGNGIAFFPFQPEVTPGNVAYAILSLPTFTSLQITIPERSNYAGGLSGIIACAIQSVDISGGRLSIYNESKQGVAVQKIAGNGSELIQVSSRGQGSTYFVGCSFGTIEPNCGNGNNGTITFIGCGFFGDVAGLGPGYKTSLDVGCLLQGPSVSIRATGPGQFVLNDVGCFDSFAAVIASNNGVVSVEATVWGTSSGGVWGTSAVASSVTYQILPFGCVRNATGTTWVLASPHQGALHATTDATVGGQNDMNSFDRASGNGAYVGKPLMTMAKLDAAVGAAGFGGNAWSPEYGAGLVKG